jgi:hypothetical protein
MQIQSIEEIQFSEWIPISEIPQRGAAKGTPWTNAAYYQAALRGKIQQIGNNNVHKEIDYTGESGDLLERICKIKRNCASHPVFGNGSKAWRKAIRAQVVKDEESSFDPRENEIMIRHAPAPEGGRKTEGAKKRKATEALFKEKFNEFGPEYLPLGNRKLYRFDNPEISSLKKEGKIITKASKLKVKKVNKAFMSTIQNDPKLMAFINKYHVAKSEWDHVQSIIDSI